MAGELRRGVVFKPGKKKRTVLARPKKRATKASDEESRVMDRAVEVIGDKNEAMRWMGTPVRALDYSTPVSLLGTRKGRQAVIAVLGRLEHGVL
jgi:putative toxin-antitoxin system antitoxin component (TIGR02293 family)